MSGTLLGNSPLLATLDGALGLYDGETSNHCLRVSRIATRMGTAMGLDVADLEALAWAGVLHDLGKLAVPAEVLKKLGPLDESDWAQIKRHPVAGAEIMLASSPAYQQVAAAIRSHHER